MECGLRAAAGHMYQQDKIWSRYSSDKVDIAGTLARLLRTLARALPLEQPLMALSVGSSNEPQFRILQSFFRGGLYLLDIENAALDVIEERVERQRTRQVHTIHGDYRELLCDAEPAQQFRRQHLGDERMTLVTLHAVLMASRSDDTASTIWLYNHVAERFRGCHNDQNLLECADELRRNQRFSDAQILSRSSRVEFFVDDFEQFMAVVWMILLHPNVHNFPEEQQREVIVWVYDNLWSRGLPLVQIQDHLVIYRGRGMAGLV